MSEASDYIDEQLDLHERLRAVKYPLKDEYKPNKFALMMLNFMKLVHEGNPTENKTPVMHLKMLDKFVGENIFTVNCMFRGSAKTTLEHYLILYLATFGHFPDEPDIYYGLYVADSIDNNVKKMRLSLETTYNTSPFLQEAIPVKKFTDVRWFFENADGKQIVFTGHGALTGVRGPLSLDSKVYTDTGTKTIKDVQVGDEIYTPNGTLTKVIGKSPVFNDAMYEMVFDDGRTLKCDGTHLHPLYVRDYSGSRSKTKYKKILVTTNDIVNGKPLASGTLRRYFTKLVEPIQYTEKDLPLDPYLVGLLLGDGFMQQGKSARLSGLHSDVSEYLTHLSNYEVSETDYLERSGVAMKRVGFLNTHKAVSTLGLSGKVDYQKHIPNQYMYGSINQRKDLLAGMLDTDGTCTSNGYVQYSTVSKQLADDIIELARSLGHRASMYTSVRDTTRRDLYRISISTKTNPFKLKRKANRFKPNTRLSDRVALVEVNRIADEPSQCIRVEDSIHEFITDGYLATHNTKELNYRPQIALLDDLMTDEAAASPTQTAKIKDTIYNAVIPALHPDYKRIIWNGTPFNMADPLTEAIGSGGWDVNVFPVCEQFPCAEEDYRPAWGDRFTYKSLMQMYKLMKANGRLDAFYQEYMLQVVSDEDRLVNLDLINWYSRQDLLTNKANFNFYITTDYATTEEDYGDPSVQLVWAYNNVGQWFLVDGFNNQVDMGTNIDRTFDYVQMYKPIEVGIEISGQQKGFIPWIKREMMGRNIFFNLAKDEGSKKEGLSPKGRNKLTRFMVVAPWFNAGMFHFPEELRDTPMVTELLHQLGLVTHSGIKSKKDDLIDGVSQLGSLRPWKPSAPMEYSEDGFLDALDMMDDDFNSYIV